MSARLQGPAALPGWEAQLPTSSSFLAGLRLAGKTVLVVGGGTVGTQRVRTLLPTGARISVVAPRVSAELDGRAAGGEITLHRRTFRPADLDGMRLVLAAVDDPEVAIAIATYARSREVWVNVADQPELCDFFLPAVHREGPLQIAVSTDGVGPGMAARIRDHVATRLPERVGEALARFGAFRQQVRARAPGREDALRRMARVAERSRRWSWGALASLDVEKEAARWDAPVVGVGRIRLVGAGPGDPRLLTVAALEAIEEADLVIADRLVPDAILGMVRGELVLAGEKHRGSDADAAQAMIDARIVAAALAGRDVVRLHVGDPSLFGRLSETLAAVEGAGLEAEIIPGVSALSALGVPLTSRGSASRVLVASARRAGGRAEELPAFDAELTLALFMAAGSRAQVAAGLRERGWPADWPVLAVSRASQPDELRQHATVGTLAGLEVPAPAVIVVGRVGAWERPGGEALLPARRASGRPAPTAR